MDYRKLAADRQEQIEGLQRTLAMLLREMGGHAEISYHTALFFRPEMVVHSMENPSPDVVLRLWLDDGTDPEAQAAQPCDRHRVTLMQSGRAGGKLAKMQELVREEILAGGHPHVATPHGMRCASPEVCSLPSWDGNVVLTAGDGTAPV